MTVNENQLSGLEIDALGELGNMGAGAAGIALSKFLNRDVSMSLPRLRIITRDGEDKFFNEASYNDDEVALIRMSVVVHLKFEIFCIINKASFNKLLGKLFSDFTVMGSLKDYQSIHYSLIKEVGSILILQYITALNKLLKMENVVTYPTLHLGKFEDALEEVNNEYLVKDEFKCDIHNLNVGINLDIFTVEDDILFELVVLPCEGTIQGIIERLGL